MVIGRGGACAFVLLSLSTGLSCTPGASPAGPGAAAAVTPTVPPANPSSPAETPAASPTSPARPTPPTEPTAPPAVASSCPIGDGTLDTHCAAMPSAYVGAIDGAITALTRTRPEIFNLSEEAGPGQYRVMKLDAYIAGVVDELRKAGFCAEAPDLQSVLIKKDNELSERYAIVTSAGFVRRGEGSYRESCRPAIFPVPDAAHIASIRVAFYGIQCPDGRTPPDNAEKILPIGCTGTATATPKDRNNRDVDAKIHGSEIFWQLQQGEGENNVRISDFPGQPFNKFVDGLAEGYFGLCASVKGVTGCLGATVVR
jgi:hypothetical protein